MDREEFVMIQEKKYPKLPKIWKKKFLEALRNKCYKFTKGDWYRLRRNSKTGQVEATYCTLGAAYHFSTGEDKGSQGFNDPKVPKAFKDDRVRDIIVSINDAKGNRSYRRTADWIDEHL